MNSKLLIAVLVLCSASVFAAVPTQHLVDGVPVGMGALVETNNPFEYKIIVSNDSDDAKSYTIEEIISNQLVLDASSHPFSTVALGVYNKYVLDEVEVPANSSVEIVLIFKNVSDTEIESASIATKFRDIGDGVPALSEYEFFLFNAVTPAIPEFPLPVVPVIVSLGIAFVVLGRPF